MKPILSVEATNRELFPLPALGIYSLTSCSIHDLLASVSRVCCSPFTGFLVIQITFNSKLFSTQTCRRSYSFFICTGAHLGATLRASRRSHPFAPVPGEPAPGSRTAAPSPPNQSAGCRSWGSRERSPLPPPAPSSTSFSMKALWSRCSPICW